MNFRISSILMKCSQRRYQGMVLLIVLLFVQIIAWLSFDALSFLAFLRKEQAQSIQQDEYKVDMMRYINMLSQNMDIDSLYCLIDKPLELLDWRNVNWWDRYACHDYYDNRRYDYVVLDLGIDVCAQVNAISNHLINYVAHYYRLSLKQNNHDSLCEECVWDVTIILPVVKQGDCQMKSHLVSMGIQSIREMN